MESKEKNILDNLHRSQSKSGYDDDKSINDHDPNRKF